MPLDCAATTQNVSHSDHAVIKGRKAFPAHDSACKYPASIDPCTVCVFVQGYCTLRIPRSLPRSDGELFLMDVTSSGGPGGCDKMSS